MTPEDRLLVETVWTTANVQNFTKWKKNKCLDLIREFAAEGGRAWTEDKQFRLDGDQFQAWYVKKYVSPLVENTTACQGSVGMVYEPRDEINPVDVSFSSPVVVGPGGEFRRGYTPDTRRFAKLNGMIARGLRRTV